LVTTLIELVAMATSASQRESVVPLLGILFAMPFIGLTRQVVFAGYYASVGLIAIGGAISVRAHTMMA